MLFLSLLLFALAALAFCAYLGYGPAKLLLRPEQRDDEGPFALLLGYVLLLLIGYYGVQTVLNLRQALLVAAGIGTLLNAIALWHRRGERLHLNLRAHAGAYLLAGLAFLLGIVPLLSYGYVTVIGENWDPENYLPVAEYLVRVPVKGIPNLPPSPLRELNANPPRIGLTLGFSVAQGIWQQLVGWDALRSFAPTLALLRGLTVLASYLLFRRTLRMERWVTLVASALVCLHAQGLWLSFMNFGMQVSSLPLVPLGLVLLADLLRHPDLRSGFATSLAVAAIPVSYYPALTVFVPTALALGAVELFCSRRRVATLLAGLGTAAGSVGIAWGTVLDYGRGFAFRYSLPKTTLGLTRLITVQEILGLAPFAVRPERVPQLLEAFQTVALCLLALLALLALIRVQSRWYWLAIVVPGVLYLLWLRGSFLGVASFLQARGVPIGSGFLRRLQPYPYAFMKGASYVAPFLLGLAAQGLAVLASWRTRTAARALTAVAAVFVLGLAGWSCGRVIARYAVRPALFDRPLLEVEQAVALIPKGAPVYLTNHPERIGPVSGLLAYFLREHPLRGTISTAYSGMRYCLPGEAFPYALLDLRDDPYVLGFFPEDRIWQGGGMVLYRRDPHQRSFVDLRPGGCEARNAEPALGSSPLAGQLLALPGPCQKVAPDTPLYLYFGEGGLSSEVLSGTGATSGTLLLSWVSLAESPGLLQWDDGTAEEITIPAGFSVYRTALRPSVRRVEVTAGGPGQAAVCWAAQGAEEAERDWIPLPRTFAFLSRAEAHGSTLSLEVRVASAETRPLHGVVEVWENRYSGATHYAWWGPLPLPEAGSLLLEVDLEAREARGQIDGETVALPPHVGAAEWPAARDGSYFASLWVYYGEAIQSIPVARFEVAQGTVQELVALPSDPLPLYARALSVSAQVAFGEGLQLVGYEFPEGPHAPGEVVPVFLEWRSRAPVPVNYAVTLQVIGPGGLLGQVDVPLGGEAHPTTTWRRGEMARIELPVRLEQTAPRGRHRLIVAVYDPATLQRLPVLGPGGEELGDAFELGQVVIGR